MVKDYAKRQSYPSRPQRGKLILIIIIAVGIVSLFPLTFLKLRRLYFHKKAMTTLPILPQPAASAPPAPQFDFYTLLPKMQVTVPKQKTEDKERR